VGRTNGFEDFVFDSEGDAAEFTLYDEDNKEVDMINAYSLSEAVEYFEDNHSGVFTIEFWDYYEGKHTVKVELE
jgi:hypothetical protein